MGKIVLKQYFFNDLPHLGAMTLAGLGSGNIALAGGNTFKQLFPHWLRQKYNWRLCSFFPVDERVVNFDSPDSNWGNCWRLFLRPLAKNPERQRHFLSAAEYNRYLLQFFTSDGGDGSIPVFDHILLGLGADGHVAGLFPGGGYSAAHANAVIDSVSPLPPHNRVTLAPAVFIAARRLSLIVYGAEKKTILAEVLNGNINLPATQVLAERTTSDIYIHQPLLQR